MDGPLATGTTARGGGLPALRGWAPPPVEFPPITPAELRAWFSSGAPELEDCERFLAWTGRGRGAIDVTLAELLAGLCQGERLGALGCHLDDYAREVLDLGRRAALELVRLGRGLRSRPLLREAMRAGRVQLRAAQTVLPVALGEDEADWVELAAHLTVRELAQAVRRERAGTEDEDEEWLRLHVALEPDDRALVDEAVARAGEVVPGTSRMERMEALAQELLADLARDPDEDERRRLWPAFRGVAPGRHARRAALEAETERWCALPAVRDWPAPEVHFDDAMSADEVDALLRALATVRA